MNSRSLKKKALYIAIAILTTITIITSIILCMPQKKANAESNYFPESKPNSYLYQINGENCFQFMNGSLAFGNYSPTKGDIAYNINWWVYLPVTDAGTNVAKSAPRFYLGINLVSYVFGRGVYTGAEVEQGAIFGGSEMLIIPVNVATTTPNTQIFTREIRFGAGYSYQTLIISFQVGEFYKTNYLINSLAGTKNYCRTQEVPYMNNNATLKYPGVAYNNSSWGTLTFTKVKYRTEATTTDPYGSMYLKVLGLNGNTSIYKKNITANPFPTEYIYNRNYAAGFGSLNYAIYTESEYLNYGNEQYNQGKNEGYSNGYTAGYNMGIGEGGNYTFLNLMTAVIDAPIKSFTGLLNFEILGFNIMGLITALLTVALILKIISTFSKGG